MLLRLAIVAFLLLVILALPAMGCASGAGGGDSRRELILATTTSTQDTGLLDAWIPMFEERYPYSVKLVAVGSGQALEMGRKGECDVMLVHSPGDEEELVEEGFAVNRRPVMHNDFIIVGPPSDPAGVRTTVSAAEAFKKIAASGGKFISRGDRSGTHVKELEIWEKAGLRPAGAWYLESGKGMGDTLRIASEEGAYTLTDRGTFLQLEKDLESKPLLEGDETLYNYYHVMEVNPEKWPDVNVQGARAFSDFVTGREAQEFLLHFGREGCGQPLFFPDALQARRVRPGRRGMERGRGTATACTWRR